MKSHYVCFARRVCMIQHISRDCGGFEDRYLMFCWIWICVFRGVDTLTLHFRSDGYQKLAIFSTKGQKYCIFETSYPIIYQSVQVNADLTIASILRNETWFVTAGTLFRPILLLLRSLHGCNILLDSLDRGMNSAEYGFCESDNLGNKHSQAK